MRVLVVAGHGSADPRARHVAEELAAAAAVRRPGLVAVVGFLGQTSPSVDEVLAGLGARPAVVLPLLLASGEHSKVDLPARLARARAAGADLRYGRPFGTHPLVLAAVADRLTEARVDPAAPVVLAAAGSSDPAANAELAASARLLCEARQLAPVEAANLSISRPTVAQALDRLARLGHPPAAVAVVPFLLAAGRFADEAAAAAATAGAASTAPLGAHPALAQLLLERYDEALAASCG